MSVVCLRMDCNGFNGGVADEVGCHWCGMCGGVGCGWFRCGKSVNVEWRLSNLCARDTDSRVGYAIG